MHRCEAYIHNGIIFLGEHWLPWDKDKNILGWRLLMCGAPPETRTGVACLIPPNLSRYVADFVLWSPRIIQVTIRTLAGPLHVFAQHAPPGTPKLAKKRAEHYTLLGDVLGALPEGALKATFGDSNVR